MQGDGNDNVYVVNAVAVKHLNENLERSLTNIRRLHRRNRHADVIHRDGYAHPRLELSEQWIATVRMIERVANRSLPIYQTFDWRVRVNDTRAHRQIFENEIHARSKYARRAIAIDVDNGFVRLFSKLKCHKW